MMSVTTKKLVSGVYAAVLTPRFADDAVDVKALRALIVFLMAKGISKFAMNGATGEFCLTTPEQLRIILRTVQEASDGKAEILCGVGAPGSVLAKELAAIAESAEVKGLLLPMPYFFPYQQEDLDLFSRDVAASTKLPILLYNLPQFTSGLEKETVRRMITEVPNIVGIKDSSGSLEILRDLTDHGVDACKIVGNDNALAPAMKEGICDGVVSGVACAMPEVILSLYGEVDSTGSEEFATASRLLSEFIQQLDAFPTPWGLKWIVEARGIVKAGFSQPVTEHRIEQSREMIRWFGEWLPTALAICTQPTIAK
jgi:4-hydroxy-tetrahydrodipicolinate synthase